MAVDLGRIGKMHSGMVAGGTLVAFLTSIGEPISLLAGGAVMGANFALLRLMVGYVCAPAADQQRPRRAALAIAAFVLKFSLFLGLLAAMFLRLPIAAMSFAVGATMLIVAIVIEALRAPNAGPIGPTLQEGVR
jgi:hypothetical protein